MPTQIFAEHVLASTPSFRERQPWVVRPMPRTLHSVDLGIPRRLNGVVVVAAVVVDYDNDYVVVMAAVLPRLFHIVMGQVRNLPSAAKSHVQHHPNDDAEYAAAAFGVWNFVVVLFVVRRQREVARTIVLLAQLFQLV